MRNVNNYAYRLSGLFENFAARSNASDLTSTFEIGDLQRPGVSNNVSKVAGISGKVWKKTTHDVPEFQLYKGSIGTYV